MADKTNILVCHTRIDEATCSFTIEWRIKKNTIDKLFSQTSNEINCCSDIYNFNNFYDSSWKLSLRLVDSYLEVTLDFVNASIGKERFNGKLVFIRKANTSSNDLKWNSDLIQGDCIKTCLGMTNTQAYRSCFWKNEEMTIVCKADINVFKDIINTSERIRPIPIAPFNYYFSILLKNNIFSDITIKCKDRLFKAHRVILALRSSYFNEKFSNEPNNSEIEIDDLESDQFEALGRYIYTNKLPDDFENSAKDWMVIGHKFGVSDLLKYAEYFVKKEIALENCLTQLVSAEENKNERLKQIVFYFMVENFKELEKRDDWIQFCTDHSKLSLEVHQVVFDAANAKI